jgi:hypothetical protein
LWDILDLMRQAGLPPLAPSLGVEGMWPGPITGDGIRLEPSNAADGAASIAQTLAMHAALAEFDDAEALLGLYISDRIARQSGGTLTLNLPLPQKEDGFEAIFRVPMDHAERPRTSAVIRK